MKNDLTADVARYYSDKLSEHGTTARGVDWNGYDSQFLRFEQLIKVFSDLEASDSRFVVADLGCGYGALYDYIAALKYNKCIYHGYDISDTMCQSATERIGSNHQVLIQHSSKILMPCDFSIASGVFSVKLNIDEEAWLKHILEVMNMMDNMSEKGFSFNCLTSYSDEEKKRDHLYYADPMKIFDYCKSKFSKNVALLHDYDLYEFTILVRK